MTIVSNAGYNASTSQNQVTKLRFKTSNGGSNNGGFYGDGSAYRLIPLGTNSVSPSIIRVVQTSTTSYKIYGSFSTFTGGGSFYQVSIQIILLGLIVLQQFLHLQELILTLRNSTTDLHQVMDHILLRTDQILHNINAESVDRTIMDFQIQKDLV